MYTIGEWDVTLGDIASSFTLPDMLLYYGLGMSSAGPCIVLVSKSVQQHTLGRT